jgi:hypothetical protein
MDFQELRARVLEHARAYSAKYGVVIDEDFALLKLCELADIVGMAIVAADLLGIDLEQAMAMKWLQKDV